MNPDLRIKLLTFGLVALLAACGSQTAERPETSQDAQTLSETALGDLSLTGAMLGDASAASLSRQSVGVDSLEANAQSWGLPRRVTLILKALGHYIPNAASGACTIRKDGDLTDADDDGVPVNATITFSCSATGPQGATYDTEGSLTLKDTNDAQAESGYSVEFQGFKARVSSDANHSVTRTLEGTYTLGRQTSTYQILKKYTYTIERKNFSNTTTSSLVFDVSKTYTPDPSALDAGQPFSAGTIVVDKASPGSAVWNHDNNSRTLQWYTDPNLHWNRAACQVPERILNFDSGAKVYTYTNPAGQQSTLRIAFSGCGDFQVTFNGQPMAE
ncbi:MULTISPECIES: hypothetical protein [unclassified Meiothermus]|uniref:hypothetical protein n=1 Tax=unclassified Meiothermus TaxID=370471 RepID=UPI000D7B9519|nr:MULTISPECIES: hypothetical protein [unclassified Meiothermus]PZA06127.1 hypothetical protein DNA98_15260 [Meiothermus sp. Pnk-1]RYM35401.1 hypothetical protein EWH23_11470 [Meiothermus sp. PNK-Is4]